MRDILSRISSRVLTICFRTFRRAGLAESLTSAFSSIAAATAASMCLSGRIAVVFAQRRGAINPVAVPLPSNFWKNFSTRRPAPSVDATSSSSAGDSMLPATGSFSICCPMSLIPSSGRDSPAARICMHSRVSPSNDSTTALSADGTSPAAAARPGSEAANRMSLFHGVEEQVQPKRITRDVACDHHVDMVFFRLFSVVFRHMHPHDGAHTGLGKLFERVFGARGPAGHVHEHFAGPLVVGTDQDPGAGVVPGRLLILGNLFEELDHILQPGRYFTLEERLKEA